MTGRSCPSHCRTLSNTPGSVTTSRYPPGLNPEEPDEGSGQLTEASQRSLELRLSRYVSDGLHEDVDLTNFTQQKVPFTLSLEVDADFADIEEASRERKQKGEITREWRRNRGQGSGVGGRGGGVGDASENWALSFDYKAEHEYGHAGKEELPGFIAE